MLTTERLKDMAEGNWPESGFYDTIKEMARVLLAKDVAANRHDESNYPEIPEGCVVVPLVPTTEMIAAAMDSIDVTFDDDDYIFVHHDTIYAAMLAAAPKLDGCK
ncbi:hypothetical protein [Serratia symbiotica]|uniref:Uncharacterized protein n=1 Tax=Serratia symbiotica SCt-VLC TaxID=1347341 RepID=A0A068RD77_9GAMM|nr:hypothetical protein [Serratia symbiotica]CDG49190.1 hypothetical protein SCTVLC_2562 [Serratia symbiotica SCt-VLC]